LARPHCDQLSAARREATPHALDRPFHKRFLAASGEDRALLADGDSRFGLFFVKKVDVAPPAGCLGSPIVLKLVGHRLA